MKRVPILLTIAMLAVLGACSRQVDLDTRTFALQYIESWEAAALIGPYIYGDREGAPGGMSEAPGAITVRETQDNLERIERVLDQFDQPKAEVQLHFQLIEANGAGDADPAIAQVETELRGLFRYEGYRLIGQAFATTSADGGEINQELLGISPPYSVYARVISRSPESVRLEEITLVDPFNRDRFRTSVRVRVGQTLVLGSTQQREREGEGALILTVRAERVEH